MIVKILRIIVRSTIAVLLMANMSGCSSVFGPGIMRIRFDAGRINDNSTLLVRVYQLKSKSVMQSSDPYLLLHREEATLGSAKLQKEELFVEPHSTKVLELKLDAETNAVAVVGFFRNIAGADWHAVADVPRGKSIDLGVSIVDRSLRILPQK